MGTTAPSLGTCRRRWVNTSDIISDVIVLPITGWLADRCGRRRYFAASITAFTLASLHVA